MSKPRGYGLCTRDIARGIATRGLCYLHTSTLTLEWQGIVALRRLCTAIVYSLYLIMLRRILSLRKIRLSQNMLDTKTANGEPLLLRGQLL